LKIEFTILTEFSFEKPMLSSLVFTILINLESKKMYSHSRWGLTIFFERNTGKDYKHVNMRFFEKQGFIEASKE
jgi:hypothetical protein